MPELPEVETVMRGLAPAMQGQRFARVLQRRPNLRWPFPERFAERLTGARIETMRRRAKFILADLSSGETLVMHLGMSGRFTVALAEAAMAPGAFHHDPGGGVAHDHVVFEMSNGATITYNDPRRFGFMSLLGAGAEATDPHFAGLGIEPLGNTFHADALDRLFAGKAAPLKAALLDQRLIAGLGNIYVCEALHRAHLSPYRAAGTLSGPGSRKREARERLAATIRDVLTEAIAAGGSSLKDYAQTDGALGYFQHTFRVYDREGEPCPTPGCTGSIRRDVQAGRSTWWCGRCQR
jgi:formamidopyrimidine-DNA glycosylase